MNATDKDRDVLARTLRLEAHGEGLAEQIVVAWTIRNRLFDSKAKSWWMGRQCVPGTLAVAQAQSAAGIVFGRQKAEENAKL